MANNSNQKKYASLTTLQNLVNNIKSLFATKSDVNTALSNKADKTHNHDDRYYTETEVDNKLSGKSDTTHNHDAKYDPKGSASAVQTNLNTVSDTLNSHTGNADIHVTTANKTNWNSAYTHSTSTHARVDATKVEDSTTNGNIKINGTETNVYSHPNSGVSAGTYKSVTVNAQGHVTGGSNPTTLAGYGITDGEAKGTASSTVSTHNTSTSAHADIRDLITGLATRLNTLANSDDTTLDQLSEIVAYIKNNKSLIDGVTANKVNVSDIINNLTTNVSNKPLSAAQGVEIKRLIDALDSAVDTHDANTTKHITSTERTNWNVAKTHADSDHAPSNAEKNQNAFSNIKVGTTTIAADTTTDTLILEGSNVTITPDATNDKVTISVADSTTSAKGVVKLTDSVTSTSTTTAATPNSVKSAYDLANTAKTTADGKANAVHKHTVSEISDLTATATELNYMDGVTSNVQAQLDELENAKAEKIHIHPYGVCSTDGATAAKTITVSDFALTTGVRVVVKFTTTNTASSPTLNVNGTGAKNIYYRGSKIYTSYLAANKVYEFVYDGSYWILIGDNTTGLMTTSDPAGTGTISINRKAETTSGAKSVAMGNNTTASSSFSVAFGDRTIASAQSAFAEGSYTTASGVASHAEGNHTTASADASHAEGNSTEASGFASHSEGNSTVASGKTAHAEGYITDATGEYSHSEGYYTKASSDYQHVQGSYNIEDADGKYLHIVGNGRDNGDSVTLSNAHTIDWDGNGWFQGDVYVGGEHQDDYGVSKLVKESDYEWNLIYNSGSITAKANSISGIDISGYKRIMVAASCVNDGTNISKSGSVIFTGENGKTYQFPCWTNMFSTTANATSAGIAQFDIIYGYIVCPTALRSIRTSNFLTAGEGGTADNLTSTGGGIMRCTDDLVTLAVSSLDQDANCYFGVGSKVMVWGCKV